MYISKTKCSTQALTSYRSFSIVLWVFDVEKDWNP